MMVGHGEQNNLSNQENLFMGKAEQRLRDKADHNHTDRHHKFEQNEFMCLDTQKMCNSMYVQSYSAQSQSSSHLQPLTLLF